MPPQARLTCVLEKPIPCPLPPQPLAPPFPLGASHITQGSPRWVAVSEPSGSVYPQTRGWRGTEQTLKNQDPKESCVCVCGGGHVCVYVHVSMCMCMRM